MDGEAAAEVVRHVRAMGRQLNAYIDDELFVEQVTDEARRYAEHVEVGIDTVDDLEAEVLRRPPTKLVLVTSPADVDAILPGLQERWRGRLYVTRSQPDYIEFADGSVSKSGALAWLCERLAVERETVVALGDGITTSTCSSRRGSASPSPKPPSRCAPRPMWWRRGRTSPRCCAAWPSGPRDK